MSKTPFNYFDKSKKIPLDLSIQEHRDIAIERNKTLENVINNGISHDKICINVTVEISFDCYKCGSEVSITDTNNVNLYEYELEKNIPKAKCSCCNTKYSYNRMEEVFDVVITK